MANYQITEQGEVMGLEFGLARADLRSRLGDHIEFERPAGRVVDFYVDHGLQLSFDDDDRLGYVSIVDPATVTFSGIELLNVSLGEVQRALAAAGIEAVLDEDGLTIDDPSIALWSSAADEPEEPIESVAVGNPDLA